MPSVSAPTGGGPVTQASAQPIVERYLDDINSNNISDARTLVCTAQRNNIDGDFNTGATITNRSLVTATPDASGITLTYSITLSANGNSGTVTIDYGLIDESGPKICSEQLKQ